MLAFFFFFFNDTATTEIYTLSLHDALPISDFLEEKDVTIGRCRDLAEKYAVTWVDVVDPNERTLDELGRSEEHTSELQSRLHLVCRLLLEKKKQTLADHDETKITNVRDSRP